MRLYSVFGGIPYYNRLIDLKLSAKENIIELIVSPGARLENEVIMYLKAEISKLINANEVFEALAKGYSRYLIAVSCKQFPNIGRYIRKADTYGCSCKRISNQ
ncbi:MAG: hypothetical protein SOX73_03035 [Porcincola intestinalis]|nr:hypothetical protein [Porcincola intestinalis]